MDMTLAQAGDSLGLSPETLRSQIRFGKLKGRKFGPLWTVSRREVERYRKVSLRQPDETAA